MSSSCEFDYVLRPLNQKPRTWQGAGLLVYQRGRIRNPRKPLAVVEGMNCQWQPGRLSRRDTSGQAQLCGPHSARALHGLIQGFPYGMAHTVSIAYSCFIRLTLVKPVQFSYKFYLIIRGENP